MEWVSIYLMKIYKKILAWVNAVIDDLVGADGLKHIVVSAVLTALLTVLRRIFRWRKETSK